MFSKIKKIFSKKRKKEDFCPNCGCFLEELPQRKAKCKDCNEFIFIRADLENCEKILLTEENCKKFDDEKTELNYIKKWLTELEEYGVTQEDFEKMRNNLDSKLKTKASNHDIIWGLFNTTLTTPLTTSQLRNIYFRMAHFLGEEGRNPKEMLYQSHKMQLLEYKETGVIGGVEIFGCANSCEQCRKKHGKHFNIEEALKKMPLPCDNCSYQLYGENGFCRCTYIPILED